MKTLSGDLMQTIGGTRYMYDGYKQDLYRLNNNSGWWELILDLKLKVDIIFKMGFVPPLPKKKTINQKLMDAF